MICAHDQEILEAKCERLYDTQSLATPAGTRLIRSRRHVILDDDGSRNICSASWRT